MRSLRSAPPAVKLAKANASCQIARKQRTNQLNLGNGFTESRRAEREGARRRTNFGRRSSRAVFDAAGRIGRAGGCAAKLGQGKKLRRTRTGDRDLHRRSQY